MLFTFLFHFRVVDPCKAVAESDDLEAYVKRIVESKLPMVVEGFTRAQLVEMGTRFGRTVAAAANEDVEPSGIVVDQVVLLKQTNLAALHF